MHLLDEENHGPPGSSQSAIQIGQTARTANPYETQELTNLLKQANHDLVVEDDE